MDLHSNEEFHMKLIAIDVEGRISIKPDFAHVIRDVQR